jgi:hypothetical protein
MSAYPGGANRVEAGIKPKGKRSARQFHSQLCHDKVVKEGKINMPDGSWTNADSSSGHHFMLGGYKLIKSSGKKSVKKNEK